MSNFNYIIFSSILREWLSDTFTRCLVYYTFFWMFINPRTETWNKGTVLALPALLTSRSFRMFLCILLFIITVSFVLVSTDKKQKLARQSLYGIGSLTEEEFYPLISVPTASLMSLDPVFAQPGIVLDFPRTNTNTCLLLWKETVVLYIAALNTGAKVGKKFEITLIYERNLLKCIIFYYYLTWIARITLIFFTNLFILTSICPAELAENAENILQKQKIHLLRYYSSKEPYVLSVMSVFLKTSFYTTVTSLSTSTVVAIIPQSAKTTFHWKTIYTLWIHHIMNLKNKPADKSGLRS